MMADGIPPLHPKQFQKQLLTWYRHHKRDMPWRRTNDPYAIWVSEIMLQQTTVATVRARWGLFLDRWPTVEDLAAAREEEVLHEWTGLGYYARARNLHLAACEVVDRGEGIPHSFAALRELPGLGDYTAAAIASIAFGEEVAVLDANVERVLTRLFTMKRNPRKGPGRAELQKYAAVLLDTRHPGDFNQAMMELGAMICLPKRPLCGRCAVAEFCRARREGKPESYPHLEKKPPLEEISEAAALIQNEKGETLLLLRPPTGSFASMWETPRTVCKESESPATAAARAAKELAGLEATIQNLACKFRHTVMRQRINLQIFRAHATTTKITLTHHTNHRWVTPEQWQDLPKSTTQAKLARLVLEGPNKKEKGGSKEKKEEDGETAALDLFG